MFLRHWGTFGSSLACHQVSENGGVAGRQLARDGHAE